MKTYNLSISNLTRKRSEAMCKIEPKLEPSKAEPSKVPPKAPNKVPKAPNKLPTMYRDYTPKIRQQVISNKLLNSKLYELYTVSKLHCAGTWLKDNIVDGTITMAKQTYIVAWLDTLPIDAYKEDTLCISLRTPKYKDSRTGEYPHSYAVVSKLSNQP